jgi:peroxiredoxin Q/BCP
MDSVLRWFFATVGAVASGLVTRVFGARAPVVDVVQLAVGDLAPDFALPGSDGRTYRLADYRGRSAVVLAWFPKAFTGG